MRVIAMALCAWLAIGGCQRGNKVTNMPQEIIHLPGAEAFSSELSNTLSAAVASKGPNYAPRTRHLKPDGSALYTNRLATEPSPYLQQHAHNPVNWYPWGDEAFEAAKRLDRPVLLSIGYSTCHWCHVMEEESFEDVETASYINAHYIAIKVDREERPDVDSIYMSALQAMNQGGGWPLNMWLTPDRRPFYGGTYFPPRDFSNRPSFMAVLSSLSETFQNDRRDLLEAAQEVVKRVEQMSRPPAGTTAMPSTEVLSAAANSYARVFDEVAGGIAGRGPKFPASLPIRFLLRYYRRSQDKQFLDMAILTLDKMAAGGMYDQVAGGFHRYSTDQRWLVPHFEKMLYDNALLSSAYLEAFQLTGDQRHAEVAQDILAYVAREMTAPEGGFYSATDADSIGPTGERDEGYYFTWTPEEFKALLGDDSELVSRYFGVSSHGNFEGRTILNVQRSLAEVASEFGVSVDAAKATISQARKALYQARQARSAPLRDDKILVAWNGLIISAFAQASRVLGDAEPVDYLAHAEKAASFILETMRVDGRLLRSYQGGKAHLKAYVDDYAFFIAGLLELYLASGNSRWLDEAIALDSVLVRHYADEAGGFFMTADDHEELLTREKPGNDSAIPSGNSWAIMNSLKLYQLTGKEPYRTRGEAGLKAFGQVLERAPTSASEMLLAVDFSTDGVKQVVIVVPQGSDASEFAAVVSGTFLPNHIYVATEAGAPLEKLASRIPLLASKIPMDGQITAYVCEDTHCELPTTDLAVFGKQLAKVRPL